MNKGIQHFQLALFLSGDALSNSRGHLMLLDISVCGMEILWGSTPVSIASYL